MHTLRPEISEVLGSDVSEIRINRDSRSRYKEYGYEIYIPSRYVPRWLGYIGKCPVPSYRYKWDYREGIRKLWLKDEIAVLCKYWGRIDHKKITEALGVSYEQAHSAAGRYCGLGRAYSNRHRPLKPEPKLEKQLSRDILRLK
jgi:hypothetical protein